MFLFSLQLHNRTAIYFITDFIFVYLHIPPYTIDSPFLNKCLITTTLKFSIYFCCFCWCFICSSFMSKTTGGASNGAKCLYFYISSSLRRDCNMIYLFFYFLLEFPQHFFTLSISWRLLLRARLHGVVFIIRELSFCVLRTSK